MSISICVIGLSEIGLKETFNSLEKLENKNINEIIYTGSQQDIEDINLNVKCLNLSSENKAFLRNKTVESATSDYILWLKNGSIVDDDFIEEMIETINETPDADLIYPNEIVIDLNNEENVKNYKDWYKNEIQLLQGLTFEKYLPEFGAITKKEIFEKYGFFDEEFEEYEFYRFLSLNIKNLSLKLSSISFITNYITETFIDTSFHSKNLRDLLKIYSWEKDLFPELNWENEKIAKATAYSIVADKLSEYVGLLQRV